jgi:toxin HigB-1
MIRNFADARTADLWQGSNSTRVRKIPPDIQERAFNKLVALDAADVLDDLRMPPSNRLHPLHGDRKGQHSISVNKQWRICFRWEGGAHDVELTDYH